MSTASSGPSTPGISAQVDGTDVRVTWTLPSPAPLVKLVRKLNGAPSSVMDGTEVYSGTGTTHRDPIPNLLPTTATASRVYSYALFTCAGDGTGCTAANLVATESVTLAEALRAGGYVIYFRHAETVDATRNMDVCSDQLGLGYANTTSTPDWWRACTPDVQVTPDWNCTGANVRQLSMTGVDQAILAGNNMRARGFMFSRVLASEMCRGFRSAELMALGPAVEEVPDLTYYVYGNVRNRCNDVRALITTVPTAGTNVALVSHSAYGSDTGGITTTEPSLCSVLDGSGRANGAIFKPDGMGGYTQVATGITPAAWATLE